MACTTLGSGLPSVRVSIKPDIIRYRMLTPPMTTRLTMTVHRVPFLVLRTPWSVSAYFR